MDFQIDALARRILMRAVDKRQSHPHLRFLVAIAGIPGSGKTTYARRVGVEIEDLIKKGEGKELVAGLAQGDQVVKVIGLDGWHYPRAVLDTFPDPIEAHARRGAPHTFDAPSYAHFVSLLSTLPHSSSPSLSLLSQEPLYPSIPPLAAPSFSHAKKDPVELDIPILSSHRIVIVEGLYALVTKGVWGEASRKMDEKVLCEVERTEARRRLAARHVVSGICQTLEEGQKRADDNDLPNGDWLLANSWDPTFCVTTIPDESFADAEP